MIKRDSHELYIEFLARNIQGFPYICAESSQIIGWWLQKKHSIRAVYGVYNIDDLDSVDKYMCIPYHWWIQLQNGDIIDYTYPQFYEAYEFNEKEKQGSYLYFMLFRANAFEPLVKKGTYIYGINLFH